MFKAIAFVFLVVGSVSNKSIDKKQPRGSKDLINLLLILLSEFYFKFQPLVQFLKKIGETYPKNLFFLKDLRTFISESCNQIEDDGIYCTADLTSYMRCVYNPAYYYLDKISETKCPPGTRCSCHLDRKCPNKKRLEEDICKAPWGPIRIHSGCFSFFSCNFSNEIIDAAPL